MYLSKVFFLKTLSRCTFTTIFHQNPFPQKAQQDIQVTHYDCEENQQKELHQYAINHLPHCESEPQEIESKNIVATLYSKARATTLMGYKFITKFSEKKVPCSQDSNRLNKTDSITKPFTKVL